MKQWDIVYVFSRRYHGAERLVNIDVDTESGKNSFCCVLQQVCCFFVT